MALANNPMEPSTALSAIVGNKKISRPQAVKAVWAYIKKNKLQDPKDKRSIVLDEKLAKLVNGKVKAKINMMKLAGPISKNLK